MSKKLLTFVLPAYREEKNIPLIYDALMKEVKKLKNYAYEIIFVNDGSPDGTRGAIEILAEKDSHVKGINFSRNFGKEIALTSGVQKASGDAVITLDVDGQHPVVKVSEFVKKWEEGYDIVYNKREEIQGASRFKRWSSKMFYRIFNAISEIHIESGTTDYRLIDRKVADIFGRYSEKNRMYRGIVDMIGFKRYCLVFDALPNPEGREPSYNYAKLVRLAINSFTSFSTFPLKLVGYMGGIITFLSIVLLFVMFLDKIGLLGLNFTNIAVVVVMNTLLIGIVLISLGMLALYVERIHDEVVGRPLYIIQDELNF